MIVLDQKGVRERLDLIRFSPDGRALLTNTNPGVRIWNGLPSPGAPKSIAIPLFSSRHVRNVQFTPDGKTLLLNSDPLAICDIDTGAVRQVAIGPPSSYSCVFNVAPDGMHFVAAQYNYGSPEGWITCRPIASPDPDHAVWSHELTRQTHTTPTFLSGDRVLVMSVNLPWDHPDRYRAAVPLWTMYSTRTGEILATWESPELSVGSLATSPDRELLAGLRTSRLVIVSAKDLTKPLVTIRNDNRRDFTGVAFHPSGRYLAATSNDATVKLYDTQTWEVAKTYTWKIGRMRSIAFSPDGTLAAAGSDTGKVVVWDVDL